MSSARYRSSGEAVVDAPSLIHRRTVLQLLGVAALATGCRKAQRTPRPQTELIRPEATGDIPPAVMASLLATAQVVSDFVGFAAPVSDALLTASLGLKCSESPSYLGTYTDYASTVELPTSLTASWLLGLSELHRTSVVGEIAILLLMNGGFRTFGYANFNGWLGGSWHDASETRSFTVADDT
ncbi:MAG: hypothetical protein Tsb0020_36020 [Haliangiales bacterium]